MIIDEQFDTIQIINIKDSRGLPVPPLIRGKIRMIFDLQKANGWKRISAFIFDGIILVILSVGIAFVVSAITGYDSYDGKLKDGYKKYEDKYGISFDISQEELETLTEEDAKKYTDAYDELSKDEELVYVYRMIVNLTLLITSISILVGYLIIEFIVPLIFKNGQTLGKKIFGIGLMRTDGVKISTVQLFIRTVLGKYTLETMVPVLIIIMIYFNFIGIFGTLILGALLVLQTVVYFTSKTKALLHDIISGTVAVDMGSQMIFDNENDMIEYKKKVHREAVSRSDY